MYVVASSGNITCLKQEDGAIVWTKDFAKDFGGKMMSGWGYSESPLVDGDAVVCTPGGNEAMLVALNKQDGSVIWKSAMTSVSGRGKDGAGYSSIVISEGAGVKQYVQLVGRGVIGVRASDGKFLWAYNPVANDVANIPTPIVSGDYVFTSSGYGTGSALLKLEKVHPFFGMAYLAFKKADIPVGYSADYVFNSNTAVVKIVRLLCLINDVTRTVGMKKGHTILSG